MSNLQGSTVVRNPNVHQFLLSHKIFRFKSFKTFLKFHFHMISVPFFELLCHSPRKSTKIQRVGLTLKKNEIAVIFAGIDSNSTI